jgi:hypothetical protein
MTLLCHWFVTEWQQILPEVIVQGFEECHIYSALDETDDSMLWNDSEEVGVAAAYVRKRKALIVKTDPVETMKVERVTLIGEGRWYLVFCVFTM